MAYNPIPDDELAAVVTYLEMRSAPAVKVPASVLSLYHRAHCGAIRVSRRGLSVAGQNYTVEDSHGGLF